MTNLLLTLMDKVGVTVDKLGDSTGRLDYNAATGHGKNKPRIETN